jgi:hypothetical protein
VQGPIFKFLLRACRTRVATALSLALRLVYQLLVCMREQLGFQTEVVINTVYIRALTQKAGDGGAGGGQSNAYELREVTHDSD